MAVLYITEYQSLKKIEGVGGAVLLPQEPPIAEQTVVIGAGSLQSAALNAGTQFVRIHTDAICSIAVGANPTATATNRRMAANTEITVGAGAGQKIAVITNT